jgi:hypothetical protein
MVSDICRWLELPELETLAKTGKLDLKKLHEAIRDLTQESGEEE